MSQGYVVVRIDERGNGSSPGYLDTMSASTSSDFAECVEWAADQPWSTGKIGLLGISYYGGTQWRVAARRPKGLTCIIPWEGMTDYYRDRVRQGGILSNQFVKFVRFFLALFLSFDCADEDAYDFIVVEQPGGHNAVRQRREVGPALG